MPGTQAFIQVHLSDESETQRLGVALVQIFGVGDLILLEGNLGAGKTTLVRGLLKSIGWDQPVKSPTFNLLSIYPTDPAILHADLYRLQSAAGTGIEEYFDTHLCFIEWPNALADWVDLENTPTIHLDFEEDEAARTAKLSGLTKDQLQGMAPVLQSFGLKFRVMNV